MHLKFRVLIGTSACMHIAPKRGAFVQSHVTSLKFGKCMTISRKTVQDGDIVAMGD